MQLAKIMFRVGQPTKNEVISVFERMLQKMLGSFVIVMLLVGGGMSACSKPPAPNEPTEKDGGVKEGAPQEGAPQEGAKETGGQPACISARDCEDTQDCREGQCVKASPCLDANDCESDERCFEERCIKRCDVDTDCPKTYVCENGLCHKPEWKVGKEPNEGNTKQTSVKLGMAVVPLDHPLSMSMGGYGFRPGPKNKYAKALGGSEGMYDRFVVKALVIDNGKERLVVVRSPLVFTTDFLVTQALQKVIEKTGVDFTNKVLVVSTHSHSAPARFWNLLPKLNFGAFGGGSFHPEILRRLAGSFAEAIIKANEKLVPGKLGYAIERNFDPEGRIFSDRRSENGPYRHPFLLVIRADLENGTPLAALVSFPMHGIISSNTFMTNDAAGGLEFVLQEKLSAKYKAPIEVFYMQGNAGDISPRGTYLGHRSTQQMQMIGHLASPKIMEVFEKIEPKAEWPMEIVNKRIGISRKLIGYKGDEFHAVSSGEKKPYRFGAFQCVQKGHKHDSGKKHEDGKLGCLFSVTTLNGAAIPQFSKTRLTAIRLGDLVISTLPGESTSWLAKKLHDAVLKDSDGKIKDFISMGYAQDHQLYLVTEDDWWQGGYEPSLGIWGPKFGEYLLRQAKALSLQLITDKKEDNKTGILPQAFYGLDMTPTIERETTVDMGKIKDQPPKEYKRMAKGFQFSFYGGFVGVDHPNVVLQKKEGAEFQDVRIAEGTKRYDDGDYRMLMQFRKVAKDKYVYIYTFEELEDFPLGTYRFRFEGMHWDGSKRVPYKGETEPFKITASDALQIKEVVAKGESIEGVVSYPQATTDDGSTPFGELKPSGHRLRSSLVSWEVGPPLPEGQEVQLSVKIEKDGNEVETLKATSLNVRKEMELTVVTTRAKDGKEKTKKRKALTSGFSLKLKNKLEPGMYQVTISVQGPYGNTGTWGPKELEVK